MEVCQTQFDFVLPMGYVDESGKVHKEGKIRLATAADEIYPTKDAKVQQNNSYLPVVLLSRVVLQLGTLPAVTPAIIERLFIRDFAYLQEIYNRINQNYSLSFATQCPKCEHKFEVEAEPSGGS